MLRHVCARDVVRTETIEKEKNMRKDIITKLKYTPVTVAYDSWTDVRLM